LASTKAVAGPHEPGAPAGLAATVPVSVSRTRMWTGVPGGALTVTVSDHDASISPAALVIRSARVADAALLTFPASEPICAVPDPVADALPVAELLERVVGASVIGLSDGPIPNEKSGTGVASGTETERSADSEAPMP